MPRRPGLRGAARRDATLTGFLEHAAGLHAQEVDAGRPTGGSPSRRSTAPRAPRRSWSCCSAARSSCCPPGGRCHSPDPERLAEERRLFYVAATRAKDRLLITHAAERGRPPHRRPVALPRRGRAASDRPARSPPEPQPTERRTVGATGALASAPAPTQPQEIPCRTPRQPRAARAHPRRGGRAVPPAVRARRDRLSRDDQGRPTTASRTPARRSPPTSAPSRSIQRLNAVVPGRWRQQFQPVAAELVPAGSAEQAVPRLPADRHPPGRAPAAPTSRRSTRTSARWTPARSPA